MYPQRIGAYAFEIGEPAVARIVKRALPNLDLTIKTICTKDSQDITIADRRNILQAIREADERHVLITHGTDTLCDTAKFLADNGVGQGSPEEPQIGRKIIVLTGAFRPESLKDTDADFNVGFSLGVLRSEIKHGGVFVCINGDILDGRLATRRDDGTFTQGKIIS